MFDVCIDFSRIHRGKVDCVVCSLLSSAFPFKTGYVKSIPSTEHHKNGYWWRRRCVWVAASVFLKKIRCALQTIYSFFMNFKSVICGEFPKLPPRWINSIKASAEKPFSFDTDALMELILRSAELIKCKSLILLIWCTVLYFSTQTDVYLFNKTAKTCIFPKKPTRTVEYSAAAVARTSGHPWLQGFLLLQRDGTPPLHTKRGSFAWWFCVSKRILAHRWAFKIS